VSDQVLHPYKKTGKITVHYYINPEKKVQNKGIFIQSVKKLFAFMELRYPLVALLILYSSAVKKQCKKLPSAS